jgi:hypothetical protein
MKTLPWLLLLLLPLQPLVAEPGTHDRGDEKPRIVLYSGDNYTGVALELEPRAEVVELSEVRFSDRRKAHDRISSVRVFGGLRVTLFADPGFSGDKLQLTDSVPRLKRLPRNPGGHGNWDKCISSVRVGPHRREREPDGGYDDRSRRESSNGNDNRPPLPDRDRRRQSQSERDRKP